MRTSFFYPHGGSQAGGAFHTPATCPRLQHVGREGLGKLETRKTKSWFPCALLSSILMVVHRLVVHFTHQQHAHLPTLSKRFVL